MHSEFGFVTRSTSVTRRWDDLALQIMLLLHAATFEMSPVEMETVAASEMAARHVTGLGGAMAGKALLLYELI